VVVVDVRWWPRFREFRSAMDARWDGSFGQCPFRQGVAIDRTVSIRLLISAFSNPSKVNLIALAT